MKDLVQAIKNCDTEKIKIIINKNPDIVNQNIDQGEKPLIQAIDLNYVNIVKLLLELGANPDRGNCKSPLEAAILQNNAQIVKILLDAGANPNQKFDDEIPIVTAAIVGNLSIIKLLIQRGANVEYYDNNTGSALYFAALNCYEEIYKYLKILTSEELKKISNSTALSNAIRENNIEVINFLIKNDMNINSLNYGMTPLMEAAFERKLLSLKELIKYNADINKPNKKGETALFFAVRFRNSVEARRKIRGESIDLQQAVTNSLLRAGADVDVKDNKGKTPLIHAAEFGHHETVELLINSGANIQEKDNNNMTALAYAKDRKTFHDYEKKHFSKMRNILKQAGAKY